MSEKKLIVDFTKEKQINPKKGMPILILVILLYIISIIGFIVGINFCSNSKLAIGITLIVSTIVYSLLLGPIIASGLKSINPNEAIVLVLFGKYYGTIAKDGFYWVNPFCSAIAPASKTGHSMQTTTNGIATVQLGLPKKKISLKAMTLNNEKQKVNDADGNPIEIGVIVIWKIVNAAQAVFAVDDFNVYVSTQCDSAIRHVARQYPYDIADDTSEQSLRGSSQEVANVLKEELQNRVAMAGIEISEARISHLAYSPEIAAAMLQRQQAGAIIAARQKIVEGAVGMVQMALTQLSENKIVELDDERKAAMVSNLLVVLCGNKDAQPIVNSGSIY